MFLFLPSLLRKKLKFEIVHVQSNSVVMILFYPNFYALKAGQISILKDIQ